MDNRWANPEGYETRPTAVRYRIRDASGRVVERTTAVAFDSRRRRYFHSLAEQDQLFADELTGLIQRACAYFYASDAEYEALGGVADVRVSDDEVSTRIRRLEQGENTREAQRSGKRYYPLSELPFDQQRALVEQIEAHKQRWSFEILGEAWRADPGEGGPRETPVVSSAP